MPQPEVQDKLNLQPKKLEKDADSVQILRKSSISEEPKIASKSGSKAKNWLKDKSWIKEPEGEGIASNEKIAQLKQWLSDCSSSDNLQNLQIQLDWANNKPSKTTGSRLDPYNPIRAEKCLIESPDHLDHLQMYCGFCQLSLPNGDAFR